MFSGTFHLHLVKLHFRRPWVRAAPWPSGLREEPFATPIGLAVALGASSIRTSSRAGSSCVERLHEGCPLSRCLPFLFTFATWTTFYNQLDSTTIIHKCHTRCCTFKLFSFECAVSYYTLNVCRVFKENLRLTYVQDQLLPLRSATALLAGYTRLTAHRRGQRDNYTNYSHHKTSHSVAGHQALSWNILGLNRIV